MEKKRSGLNRVFLASIISLLMIISSVAYALTFNTIVDPGGMMSDASYTILVDAGTYYARNGQTGAVTSNADASTLIQSAVNALPSTGGKIFIKAGRYDIVTTINIPSFVTIEGEQHSIIHGSEGTWLILANGANTIIFTNLLKDDTEIGITLRNLVLYGNPLNNAAGTGIYFTDTDQSSLFRLDNVVVFGFRDYNVHFIDVNDFWIINCKIVDSYKICLYLDSLNDGWITGTDIGGAISAGQHGGYFYNCTALFIRDCVFDSNAEAGLVIEGGGENTISGRFGSNTGRGLKLDSSNHNIIDGCDVYNNGVHGISLWDSKYNVVSDNNVFDNRGVGATQQKAIIEEGTLSDYNNIHGNTVLNNTDPAPITTYGLNTQIHENIGYTTPWTNSTSAAFSSLYVNKDWYDGSTNVTGGIRYPVKTADYITWVSGSTYYSASGLTGSILYSGTNATTMLQNTFNAMTVGGSIYLKAGIYSIDRTITIPADLSFYIYGDGLPSLSYDYTNLATTPTDGTQIRGTTWFNNQAGINQLIYRPTSTYSTGQLGIFNLAIMPAWAAVAGTEVWGLLLYRVGGLIMDNVLFMPWGWPEAGTPWNTVNKLGGFYISGLGGGLDIKIGKIEIYGMLDAAQIIGHDGVRIEKLSEYLCQNGIYINTITGSTIKELYTYGVYYAARLSAGSSSYKVAFHHIQLLWNEQDAKVGSGSAGYLIKLDDTSTRVKVDVAYNWPIAYAYFVTAISTTDTQLIGICKAYNMGNSAMWQEFPRVKTIANYFGSNVTTPFKNTVSYSVGTSGTDADPTSARTYTANEPLDVSISAGTAQTITTKDAQGNTIDNEVATLSHRLLLNGYTLKVTFTAVGTVNVVQATCGRGGTTTTPLANVNYVIYNTSIYVTSSGGTGVSITVYDGSTNIMGNTIDSTLVTLTHYRLSEGQVINFGDFTVVPNLSITSAN